MPPTTVLSKLQTAPAGSFHVLEPAKAAKLKGRTMYVPAPLDVAQVIQAIPAGQTRTLLDIRRVIAAAHHADITCPSRTTLYWKWLAAATAELNGADSPYAIPWWRILKDGKLSPVMPGGIANQRRLLGDEGVLV